MPTKKTKPLIGVIRKIIHVELKRSQAITTSAEDVRQQGYGVIRGEDGRDVFFVDVALQELEFADLQTGQQVCYQVDDGPLLQAKSLTLPRGDTNRCRMRRDEQ